MTALVAVDGCPECDNIDGHGLVTQVIREPALFRHGGYGATRQTTVYVCFDCRWSRVAEIQEVRP